MYYQVSFMEIVMSYSLIISTFVAVAGWFIGHQFNAKRDKNNKRRDIQIHYMIKAYQNLESGIGREVYGEIYAGNIESALADIQLLGTAEQIEMAKKYSSDLTETGKTDASLLLNSLRESLRKELNLKNIDSPIFHHRFVEKS